MDEAVPRSKADVSVRPSRDADVAAMLRGEGVPTEFVELSSPYGHDAFLVEDALFAPLLSGFLAGNAAAAPLSATP